MMGECSVVWTVSGDSRVVVMRECSVVVESLVMWSIMMLVMKSTKAVKWVVVGTVIAIKVRSIVNWISVSSPVGTVMAA